jgi:hypothetical protein
MKSIALALVLVLLRAATCGAQTKPAENCSFPYSSLATAPDQSAQLAEVAVRTAVKLEECGSKNGCIVSSAPRGTPILVYRTQGEWTCGYFSSPDGAGPAWIYSNALRVVPYDVHPKLKAWVGTWTDGADHVLIRLASTPGALYIVGNAEWHGKGDNAHFGDTKGDASPTGSDLHFVQNGPNSCTIDMTLLSRYILANDNELSGG